MFSTPQVRNAAPYVLALNWSPEVDPEMVALQAEVSYLEAQVRCLPGVCDHRQQQTDGHMLST